MFCKNCGKEINDEAVICVGCGCSVKNESTPTTTQDYQYPIESTTIANCALIFAFLVPIVGVILSIIGLTKYRTPEFRSRCVTSLIVSTIVWVVSFFIYISISFCFLMI